MSEASAPTSDTAQQTRLDLHALAEHVLAAARFASTGRIGLEAVHGGFATPEFDGPAGPTVVAVESTSLVVRDGAGERRAAITTIGDAAELVGIEPGAPAEVYPPATPLDPDRPLTVEPAAAARIGAWFTTANEALVRFVADLDTNGVEADPITLWPEHFDLATVAEEVNYGASPGDDEVAGPYAYVGPWQRRSGAFWTETWGAARLAAELPTPDAVLGFWREGRERAGSDPVAEAESA